MTDFGNFKNVIGEPLVSPISVVTFLSLVEPDVGKQYSDGKFKLTQLFDRDTTDFGEMQRVLEDLARQTWNCGLEQVQLLPFKDGNEKEYSGFKNTIYITAKSKYPVGCYGPDKQPIQPKDIYPGAKCRTYLTPMAFMRGKDRGLTFLLNFVQFCEHGPRLGINSNGQDVFAAYTAEAKSGVHTAQGNGQVATAPATPPVQVEQPAAQMQSGVLPTTAKRGRPAKAATEQAASGNVTPAASEGKKSLLQMI